MNKDRKDYQLTPEEGQKLCDETRVSVEYGLERFPEVDEANQRREKDRFHQWVKARNAKDAGD